MKVRLFGIVVISFAVLLSPVASTWGAETSAPEMTPAATQEKPMEATPPAAPASPGEQPAVAEQPAEATAQSVIHIEDAVVCQNIVDRAPVGSGDVIAKESAQVYCFSRVVGAPADTQITHNWYYKGTLKSSVKLPVRSNNWRTWSSKTMMPEWTGEWMVEILSDEGVPLESIIFFIQ
jgi:hypothetical protein